MGTMNSDSKMYRPAQAGDTKKNVFSAIADKTKTKPVRKRDLGEDSFGHGPRYQYMMSRKSATKITPNTRTSNQYLNQINNENSNNVLSALKKK